MSMSRVSPVNWAAPARELAPLVELILSERGQVGELYPVLLNSPPIAAGMIHIGNAVRKEATLDAGIRELVICFVGTVNGADYEVFRHRSIAQDVGVPAEKIDALPRWPEADLWLPQERAVLQYAHEMTTSVRVRDASFTAIRGCFSDREIVELTVTIAYYNMISRILVALEIGTTPDTACDGARP
jgi:alkylhydroperoxidase family enzyme